MHPGPRFLGVGVDATQRNTLLLVHVTRRRRLVQANKIHCFLAFDTLTLSYSLEFPV